MAVFRSENRRNLIWPVIALGGVLLLTGPGPAPSTGSGCSSRPSRRRLGRIHPADAGGRRPLQWDRWARDPRFRSQLWPTFIGLPQAWETSRPGSWFRAIGLALLLPVIPFAGTSLRHHFQHAHGLEPAVATVVLLAQIPQAAQFLGVVLVVIAGIGAERSGRRTPIPATPMARMASRSSTGSQLRILWWRTAVTPATRRPT